MDVSWQTEVAGRTIEQRPSTISCSAAKISSCVHLSRFSLCHNTTEGNRSASKAYNTTSEEFYSLHNYLIKAYNIAPKALLAFTMTTQSMPTEQNKQSMGNTVFCTWKHNSESYHNAPRPAKTFFRCLSIMPRE